ncbi:class I SAM-dependent methyltransferase [Methanoregula sp.]|uniref:class I SAM-dependent methyltransferase n=1 Tax=Methanoregula sp. TaxID=2052170 RepID=UPI00237140A6|nr:class I SAM-dependent methyltransferase [Methanoregula sp.]MDD1686208.1 class I SAM-dependent methyltransferase [Methanoregula sp.]
MIPPVPGRADPDWNEIWKLRQKRHDSVRIPDDPSHDWNRKENAERYDANSRREYDSRIRITLDGLDLTRESRVLDIGAGPGTLAIPLASRVREVCAVEPGSGMISLLRERAAREGITNITCVQKRWEDVDVDRDLAGPYDIVIASLSLTMEDIRAALAKMDAASQQYVCLYWFVDLPFWERMYADLWVPLHGTPYYAGPKADCLYNVLYQMGIYANVEMMPLSKEYRFGTIEEMMAFFSGRFGVKTPEQKSVLGTYLAARVRCEGNSIVISGDSTFAKIWWKK